nr:hypothetical protein [uncultured Marinifilum sp.]
MKKHDMKASYIFLLTLFIFPLSLLAQKTVYLNEKWLSVEKENATYYSMIFTIEEGKVRVKDYKLDGTILSETDYVAVADNIDWNRLYEEGFHNSAIENGNCIEYYLTGSKKKQFEYHKGVQNGGIKVWNESGNLIREYSAINHIANGKYLEYFDSGITSYSVNFKNDSLNGPAVYYHTNGKISQEGIFKKGNKIGKWLYWNEKGEELGSEVYRERFFISGPDISLYFPEGYWCLTDQFKEKGQMNFTFARRGSNKGIKTDFTPNSILSLEFVGEESNLVDYSSFRRRSLSVDIHKVITKEQNLFSLPNSMGYLGTYLDNDKNKHSVIIVHSIQKGIGIEYIIDVRQEDYENFKKEAVYMLRSMKN